MGDSTTNLDPVFNDPVFGDQTQPTPQVQSAPQAQPAPAVPQAAGTPTPIDPIFSDPIFGNQQQAAPAPPAAGQTPNTTGQDEMGDAGAAVLGSLVGRKIGKAYPYTDPTQQPPIDPTTTPEYKKEAALLNRANKAYNNKIAADADVNNALADVNTAHEAAAPHDIYMPSKSVYDRISGNPIIEDLIRNNFNLRVGEQPVGGTATYNYARAEGLPHYLAMQMQTQTKEPGGPWDYKNQNQAFEANLPERFGDSSMGSNWQMNPNTWIYTSPEVKSATAADAMHAQTQLDTAYSNLHNALKQNSTKASAWEKIKDMLSPEHANAYDLGESSGTFMNLEPNIPTAPPSPGVLPKIARFASPTFGGAMAGLGAAQAYNAFRQGRPIEGAIDTTGAIGGALQMIPKVATRAAGALLQVPMLGYDVYQAAKRGSEKDIAAAKQEGVSPLQYARQKATAGPFSSP